MTVWPCSDATSSWKVGSDDTPKMSYTSTQTLSTEGAS